MKFMSLGVGVWAELGLHHRRGALCDGPHQDARNETCEAALKLIQRVHLIIVAFIVILTVLLLLVIVIVIVIVIIISIIVPLVLLLLFLSSHS